jgi:pimeloyl-ACP methyl ester carboxylesterase
MGAGAGVLAAAVRPELVDGLVLIGPFVRNGPIGVVQRFGLRLAMARPWAALSWKMYLPKLYAGRKPVDFDQYRATVATALRRPGYGRSFSLTTRTSHDPAEARLAEVSLPSLVVMGAMDPDFADPEAEARWIGGVLGSEVVMVAEAGHYPQSQQPEITGDAVVRFLGKMQKGA